MEKANKKKKKKKKKTETWGRDMSFIPPVSPYTCIALLTL
jgi:hypothetical protein